VRRAELAGSAAAVDKAVDDWRRAIDAWDLKEPGSRANRARLQGADRLGGEIRRLVWAPVAALLPAGTEAIYICPDGNLSRLPWAAVPGAAPGSVLLEKHAIAVVPDGPFLLERLEAKPPD